MKIYYRVGVALLAVLCTPLTLADGNAAAGKDKTAICAGCHGQDGNSMTDAFPKLAGLGEKYLIKQLQDIKAAGTTAAKPEEQRNIPEMTGMLAGMGDQDIADIAAYYANQTRSIAGAEDNKKLALGEKIYRAGNLETGVTACTACHSPSGNGNAPAGYPALGGQYASYIAKQLRAFRTGAHDDEDNSARRNDDGKIMRGVASRMTDQEIDAVANYISGLR